ncbi:MAG: carboxypeptidase-like regulatory domain-containing protein [Bacteroidetes bacterium]|nr:carboxypeptidase-like regulatory domain-containing protein [Bacteroidota bacterium]
MHPLRLLPLPISIPAFSQSRPTIHGTIRDNNSGEALIGAAITIIEQPGTGTLSNAYGFFSLTLSIPRNIPAATTIVASFIGYQPDTLHVALQSDTLIDIPLDPGDAQLRTATSAIFITAYKKYSVDGFDLDAKP